MTTHTWIAVNALLLPSIAFAQPLPGSGCTPAAHMFCVLTTADTGIGSLRQAIIDANAASATSTIGFAIPPANPVNPMPQTITRASRLSLITGNVTIDGASQPGWRRSPATASTISIPRSRLAPRSRSASRARPQARPAP